jgi:hypothetical protein
LEVTVVGRSHVTCHLTPLVNINIKIIGEWDNESLAAHQSIAQSRRLRCEQLVIHSSCNIDRYSEDHLSQEADHIISENRKENKSAAENAYLDKKKYLSQLV